MVVGLREGNVQNKCANFSTIIFGKNLVTLTMSTAWQWIARMFHEIIRRWSNVAAAAAAAALSAKQRATVIA